MIDICPAVGYCPTHGVVGQHDIHGHLILRPANETAGAAQPPEPKVIQLVPKGGPPPLGWSPQQLAEDFLKEILAGTIKPYKALVLFYEELPDGNLRPERWRAGGLRYDEEIALLHVTLAKVLDEWRGRE